MNPLAPGAGGAGARKAGEATTGTGSNTPFTPGQVLSARVIHALVGDTYLVAVRGQHLVAQSPQALTPDSVVKLAVQGGGAGEPVRVQLVPSDGTAQPATPQAPGIPELARQLGLPLNPATALVLAAFQEQGAALALSAVRQAARLVAEAQFAAPRGELVTVATSLSQSEAAPQDPAVPAGSAPLSAERSVPPAQSTTNPSVRLPSVSVSIQAAHVPAQVRPAPNALPATVTESPTPGVEEPPGVTLNSRLSESAIVSRTASSLSTAAQSRAPLTTTVVRNADPARAYRAQQVDTESVSVRALARATAPAPLAESLARLAVASLPVTNVTLPLALAAVRPQLPTSAKYLPDPTDHESAVSSPVLTTTRSIDSASPERTASRSEMPRTAPRPATAAVVLPPRITVDFAQQTPRQAAEAALRLAGVVPLGEPHALTADLGSLLRRLVVLASAAQINPPPAPTAAASTAERASAPATHSPVMVTALTQTEPEARRELQLAVLVAATTSEMPASTILREVIAQDVLPPRDLTDYDRVLALPLAIQGRPIPARLAVTTRRTADGGLACWMRVDCELSHLGPLSVRLGGADAGPVAITLVTTPAAGPLISEAIAALGDDLRDAGIDAALRVVVDHEAKP